MCIIKGGTVCCKSSTEVPPSTLTQTSTNSPHLMGMNILPCLFLRLCKLAVFSRWNRAKSSNSNYVISSYHIVKCFNDANIQHLNEKSISRRELYHLITYSQGNGFINICLFLNIVVSSRKISEIE